MAASFDGRAEKLDEYCSDTRPPMRGTEGMNVGASYAMSAKMPPGVKRTTPNPKADIESYAILGIVRDNIVCACGGGQWTGRIQGGKKRQSKERPERRKERGGIAEFMRDPDEPVTLRRNGSHGRRSPPAVASSLTRKSARGLSRRNHQLRKRGTIVLRCACRGNSAA